MRLIDRLRPFLLRWDRLLPVLAIVLPLVFSCVFGFIWLVERDLLIPFIGISIGFGACVALSRLTVGWWRRRQAPQSDNAPPTRIRARVDPDWTATERKVFEDTRGFIEEATAAPVPWPDMQPLALEVIRRVARASGRKGKDVLDFSGPEALLLVARVSDRLRSDLRDRMPFADSISIGTLYWLWQHREQVRRVQRHGMQAWRVFRLVKSLPVAILREIEGVIAEGHASFVSNEGVAVVQTLILEEVAVAAVDLYSGRLRFSDAELLQMRQAAGAEDRGRLATPDAPLRLAVAGQISSGKSSLINAVLNTEVAETDILPTTDKPQTYETSLDGLPVVLLDMPGLDGSARVAQAVQDELLRADMILWTVRANRPAREIDRAAIDALRAFFAAHPERRMPPLVVVIPFIDALLEGWPFAENFLTDHAMQKVHDIVVAVSNDIGVDGELTLPVVLTSPEWNVERLRARIVGRSADALMAQRNRLRHTSAKSTIRSEAARAKKGLAAGLSIFGDRRKPDSEE
ncbi:GTPase family protein [Sulfitobacter sp. S190]|uniref:GTPase family protein n=1 Tax=Sulfitobacter sp. S190 TaxID=2867022 RepID=UPI0021A291B1|nr:GTPase [Sulfitobacter sp. S190]UWR21746.1 50S ribosome-binding GTPase [Sulfitobacter sp. S190]